LYHIEPKLTGLASILTDTDFGADLTTLLISAATELETAWNVLRLANIPAAQRQGRIATEFIALAVLIFVPREELASLPKKKAPISKALQKYPGKSIIQLAEPIQVDPNDPRKGEPLVRATEVFTSFLFVAEKILGVPSEIVTGIGDYRKYVQHPASHGSREVIWDHFEGFNTRTKSAGAYLTRKRYPSIRFEADQIINLAQFIVDILDWTNEE
jgi:hypothetical protein